jgi:hypothetical protein
VELCDTLYQLVVEMFHALFILSQSSIAERRSPESPSTIVHTSISGGVHTVVRPGVIIPFGLPPRMLLESCIEDSWVRDAEHVWTDPDVMSVMMVKFFVFKVAIHFSRYLCPGRKY